MDYSSLAESNHDALGSLEAIEGADRRPAPARDPIPAAAESHESVMSSDAIPFSHFAAVDIRVARILDVEDVPGARKPLYKLRIDLGEELGTRNIVAGIKAYYTKEELVGKKIIVVANLAPRAIAGIPSQGMLLAAEDGDVVSLLQPDRDMKVGSKIG